MNAHDVRDLTELLDPFEHLSGVGVSPITEVEILRPHPAAARESAAGEGAAAGPRVGAVRRG